jgi:hypothetical protein
MLQHEALSLQTSRLMNTRASASRAYQDEKINRIFGGKDRIIIGKLADQSYDTSQNNQIHDYIINLLEPEGYEVADYYEGVVYFFGDGEKKNPLKLGRVLTKLGYEEALKHYREDPLRVEYVKLKQDELLILISRHPYDVAGMSTDRSWLSCLLVDKQGIKYQDKDPDVMHSSAKLYVSQGIKHGTLVAYLISPNEIMPNGKIKLHKPLARISITPVYGLAGDIAYAAGRIYSGKEGASYGSFLEDVKKWTDQTLNTSLESKSYIWPSHLYDDGARVHDFRIHAEKGVLKFHENQINGASVEDISSWSIQRTYTDEERMLDFSLVISYFPIPEGYQDISYTKINAKDIPELNFVYEYMERDTPHDLFVEITPRNDVAVIELKFAYGNLIFPDNVQLLRQLMRNIRDFITQEKSWEDIASIIFQRVNRLFPPH